MSDLIRVMTKKSKRSLPQETKYHALIGTKGFAIYKDGVEEPSVFKIGDTVSYDSYNLVYLGEIVKYSDSTVTIKPQYDSRIRRLSLNEFCWRNFGFNLTETIKQNQETSMYI